MNKMENFLGRNKLTMNATKMTLTEVMVPQKRAKIKGTPPKLETIGLEGEHKTIQAKFYTRILGYNLQNNLSMKAHMETGEKNLLGDLRRKLGALKHLGKQLPTNSRKILVNGIIWSKINYIIEIWGTATPNYIKKVQTIVNKSARYITGDNKRTKKIVLMEKLNWLDVTETIKYRSLLCMWNIIRR